MRGRRLASLTLGALLGAALLWLLWREIFAGRAQSFDTLLYARSLWGAANGDWHNPVLDAPSLAIHAHWLALLLAPFCHLARAAAVLVIAQALAFGATAYLAGRAFQSAASSAGRSNISSIGIGAWGCLITLGAPLVLNPFLFDARPDLLGVPFMTAGLLKAERDEGLSWPAIALMAPGALAREELALVLAAALLLSPAGPRTRLRHRALLAGAAIGYFALYEIVTRAILGHSALSLVQHVTGTAGGGSVLPFSQLWRPKLELLLVLAASGGGLVLPGWRWLGSTLPGVGLLLISRWLPESQLSHHYAMLVAPGLIAAATAGYRRLEARGPGSRSFVLAALCTILAATLYYAAAAAPGGQRFARHNFDLAEAGRLFPSSPRRPIHAAHARLAAIPSTAGLGAPWSLAAPVADRPTIRPTAALLDRLVRNRTVPDDIDTVALLRGERRSLGRPLVGLFGFALDGPLEGPLVVIARGRPTSTPWRQAGARSVRCAHALRVWPAAGLALCSLKIRAGEPGRAWVLRRAPATGRLSPLLVLRAGARPPIDLPLWIADGLVALGSLPPGQAAPAVTDGPLPPLPVEPVLLDGRGGVVAWTTE